MSLSTMLLSETVAEISQASKLFSNLSITSSGIDLRTPDNNSRSTNFVNSELRAKRAKEKQLSSRRLRLESGSPILRRSRCRISFKTTSPLNIREAPTNRTGARPSVSVNRISPKNKPWRKKTVLFPNPLFHSTSPTSTHQKTFYRTRSPIIERPSKTPHKFLIKNQNTSLRSHLKSKKAVPDVTVSPVKNKGCPSQQRRCSFSPSKFAKRLVSPLKTRLSFNNGGEGLMVGLKQRTSFNSVLKLPPARLSRGF